MDRPVLKRLTDRQLEEDCYFGDEDDRQAIRDERQRRLDEAEKRASLAEDVRD